MRNLERLQRLSNKKHMWKKTKEAEKEDRGRVVRNEEDKTRKVIDAEKYET